MIVNTLLIDNYDSFTYNLHALISEVNGKEPTVVRNDEEWNSINLDEYDNIIISPGPGRPEKESDFGISSIAIKESKLPVLGVCLGHQGIAYVFGSKVNHASIPMHGRNSDISHNNTGIFKGIPSPFSVVRYHSLIVESLGEEINPIAWTETGEIMGIKHKTLPIWGVQFHPESICSNYGKEIIENFKNITLENSTKYNKSKSNYNTFVKKLCIHPDAEAVYKNLFRESSHSFWLDSSAVIDNLSRFSFMGDTSGEHAEVINYSVNSKEIEIIDRKGKRLINERIFDYLEKQLQLRKTVKPENIPFEFNLGYVGYLGYELKADTQGELANDSDNYDASLLFADRMIVIDHKEEKLYVLGLYRDGEEKQISNWAMDIEQKLSGIKNVPNSKSEKVLSFIPNNNLKVEMRHSREKYLELIRNCKQEIIEGESYEICLTNKVDIFEKLDPWLTYKALRDVSPVPFGAFLNFNDVALLSASPERFLSIDLDKNVESKPIKGTRKRGKTHDEDLKLINDLLTNEKDRSENLMIVDLVRNDLNTVCEVGSVHVDKIFHVESYAPVHQLISTIRGVLKENKTSIDCVKAAFPGGSMTGAPKIRTMKIIDELEGGPRGPYSGCIGWFSLSGATDLSITIRTLVVTESKATYGVGGAIIHLSDEDEEYEETQIKSSAMLSAIIRGLKNRELEGVVKL